MMHIDVSPDVPEAEKLEIVAVELHIENSGGRPEWLNTAVKKACGEVKCKDIKEDYPAIAAYRSLYWRLGLDPTRRRVCTEGLIRIACRRGDLPRINAAVDAVNLAILETLTPMSLLDANHVMPPLVYRTAQEGDSFTPIGSKIQPLSQGMPVLADREKVLMVGYASSDSDATKVLPGSDSVLLVAYGIAGVSDARVALERASAYLERLR